MLGIVSTRTQPLFQIFVWTTSGLSRALGAPVDTRFSAQSDSIIRDAMEKNIIIL